jgi:hypothetical protein
MSIAGPEPLVHAAAASAAVVSTELDELLLDAAPPVGAGLE